MSFFMLVVIVALIFFLTWWQFSQLGAEKQNINTQNIEKHLRMFINTPLLVNENSVLDGSKLMAIQSLGQDACQKLETLFGERWYIEVEILSRTSCLGQCDASSYPCCGYWEICKPSQEPGNVDMLVLPVNVYRKSYDRTDLGLLRVGVYE